MKNKDLVARSQFIKSIFMPFPYLAVLGMVAGYVTKGGPGILLGILIAAVLSLIVGIITTFFTDRVGKTAAGLLYGQGKSTIKLHERLEGDLQQARFHKMNQRYQQALRFVDGALDQAPDFADALLLKAQILWEGFQDSPAAIRCIQEVLQLVPAPDEPLHRWATHLLADIKRGDEK